MKHIAWFALTSLVVAACGVEPSQDLCDPLVGTYTGEISGGATGSLTVVVAPGLGTGPTAMLSGSWSTVDGFVGELNSTDLDCELGTFDYEYGLGLIGPAELVCPPSMCAPGDTAGGCYCTGATLGPFRGTMDPDGTGGGGTWAIDSGAAASLGIPATTGSWSVRR